jgi:two-component sensor histidine kinase
MILRRDDALHRSRNLFAIIQSLSNLTARHSTTIDEFKSSFARRLHSLATTHDLLTREGGDGAPLAAVVRRQLASYVGDSPQVEICGREVVATAGAAQAIGMAVHELAANAFRFGALSTRSGKVSISWRFDKSALEFRPLLLRWVESDGPPVAPPSHRGLGYCVAVEMIARAIDAKIDIDFAPGGLAWVAEIPTINFRR